MFNINHLHPIVVHFPIALLITGFIFDIVYVFHKKEICFSKTGFFLLITGTITLAFAFTTGYVSSTSLTAEDIKPFLEKHERAGLLTLAVMSIASMFRIYMVNKQLNKPILNWLMLILYFIGVIAVSYTGLVGGYMVHEIMLSK